MRVKERLISKQISTRSLSTPNYSVCRQSVQTVLHPTESPSHATRLDCDCSLRDVKQHVACAATLQHMCARAPLAPTDGGESHDTRMCVFMCFGRAVEIGIYHILRSHLPFCQVRVTSQRVHIPVREQLDSDQQLLSLEQLLLVQLLLQRLVLGGLVLFLNGSLLRARYCCDSTSEILKLLESLQGAKK